MEERTTKRTNSGILPPLPRSARATVTYLQARTGTVAVICTTTFLHDLAILFYCR